MLFDSIQKRIGKVPNLYATMGYSSFALQSFLSLEENLSKGVFTAKETEAIALVVSQVNACDYCLAGHTVAAIKRGFTKEQTLEIRKGKTDDARLNTVIQLSKAVAESKGHAGAQFVDSFFDAGFDEQGLMELIGLVIVRLFTNYVFAMTGVPIDFPLAEPLS